MKTFYIHKHHGPGKMPNRHPRGFTVKITPNGLDENTVFLRGAMCSPKDQFSKKEGRSQADKDDFTIVRKRHVPMLLAKLSATCHFDMESDETNWYYIYKYML